MVLKKRQKRDGAAAEGEREADREPSGPSASAAERLAAYGEAFLSLIEGPPVVPHQKKPPKPARLQREPGAGPAAAKAAAETPAGRSARKKKKRREQKAAAKAAKQESGSAGGAAGTSEKTEKVPAAPVAKQPRVISAAEKRRFMSDDVTKIRAKAQAPPTRRGRRSEGGDGVDENSEEFKRTLREVLDFVTPQLNPEARAQWENARLRALGAQLDTTKMNYAQFQRKRKEQEQYRKERLEEEKQLGVSLSASGHRSASEIESVLRKKKQFLQDKKRRKSDDILRLGMGARESRGMAVIPQKVIRNFQRRHK